MSSVTSSVNNAAFAAFFAVVEVNWNRNHSTGEEMLNNSRGVLDTHMHTCSEDSKINYCLVSLLIKSSREQSSRE